MKIGLLVGSLRKDSYNRKIAVELTKLAPSPLKLEFVEIGNLPFFNQDLEATPPKEWVQFREHIKTLDGFILISPEYNRSTPPALKNALDVGSRPYGQSVWDKKPCAIISASLGSQGGFGANHHLRQSMVFLNVPCMQMPEVYLSQVDKLFDEHGILNEGTQNFLRKVLDAFADWVRIHS